MEFIHALVTRQPRGMRAIPGSFYWIKASGLKS